jgi:hypothetical protein
MRIELQNAPKNVAALSDTYTPAKIEHATIVVVLCSCLLRTHPKLHTAALEANLWFIIM